MMLGYIDPGTGFTLTTAGGALLAMLSGSLGIILLFFKKIFKFFKKHWRAVIIVLLLTVGISGGVFWMNRSSTFDQRVIIIGFDALSPRILEPLMADGKLPHFTRLKEQGGYRPLATTNPPQSPVAWSAFSTGKNPGKAGVFDFISRDPKTYAVKLAITDMEGGQARTVIKTPRFWQYLSKKRIPSYIYSCPVTFPPDDIHGKMISGMGVPDILGTEGTFSFYTSEPQPADAEETGGRVFYIKRSPMMIVNLTGPRLARGNAVDHVRVPVKLNIVDKKRITVELQGRQTELAVGEWSDWQEVSFDLGWWRKAQGIFKFYLVSTEPEFKLYAGPINFDPRSPLFPISSPGNVSGDLVDEVGLYHTQGMPFDTWALNEGRLDEQAFLGQVKDVLKGREALLARELARFDQGVFYFYFEDPDIIQHMFWRYIDPRHPLYEPDAPSEYKQVIYDWYQKMDAVLGRVMDQTGPNDTLIVLSDHGFDTYRRAAHLNSWLRDNGYLELKNPEAMSGGPLFKDVDWSKTQAYALGFNGIFINERGREGEGIVSPGVGKEQLKSEIISKLETWIDGKYNERVVHKAYKSEEVFWGPERDAGPDIVVGFNIGYNASWQTGLGAVPTEIMEDNLKKWSGSHLFDAALVDGILFANRPILKDKPSIMDIAPTVLKASGFSSQELQSCDFDGSPLF